jgi:predicted methyltransferase
MLKVYHEIAHPQLVLANLRAALKPGARFGIIDRNGNGADHGLNEPILRAEVERAGFRQVGRYDFTKADKQDYFLIFEKR